MSSVMYRRVDQRMRGLVAELTSAMEQYDLPCRQIWDELRALREATWTSCPVRAILLVAPPEDDVDLDPEDEKLREWIYRGMFGLEYVRAKESKFNLWE